MNFRFSKLAFTTGGRWPWLFFATMFHGFVIELISYFTPYIDNFWHAQSLIMLFDRRMPIYIAIICTINSHAHIFSIFFIWLSFLFQKKNRSSILLSCGMGNVKTEIEKWSGRVYCGWTSDCADWFAIRYNRNKICPLDMAWYRSESLYVYHDLKPFHFVIPFIYSFCIF